MPEPSSPPFPPGVAAIFEVVRRLRAPDGCPWDREQTHESLRPYLLEETYELLEAIDQKHDDAKLMEELGDVLLQVAMHAEIADQEGRFGAAQVSEAAAAKMVARHPHVFGDTEVADAEEVLRNWEHQKQADARAAGRVEESVLDRVPGALPALAWTYNMQKRAARLGFDFKSSAGAAEAVAEEARELASADGSERVFDEVGDLLFAITSLARTLKVNPEDALRVSGERFKKRFTAMDAGLREKGISYRDLGPEELERIWAETK